MADVRGNFGWYELQAADPAAAAAFYSKVVGWKTNAMEGPNGTYTILETAEGGVGGVGGIAEAARIAGPGWIGYIAVGDVDAMAEEAKKAGAKVVTAPSDIPGILRFSTIADPQGALFVLYRGFAAGGPPTGGPDQPGYVGWHELAATDGAKAFDFYSGLFGWTKSGAHDLGPMGVYQLFTAGGADIGGMMSRPPGTPGPAWNYYFQVDAIGAAVERLSASGGKVMNGPMQVPTGQWIVQCTDPQGAMFNLLSAVP